MTVDDVRDVRSPTVVRALVSGRSATVGLAVLLCVAGLAGATAPLASAVDGQGCGIDGDLGGGRGPDVVVGIPSADGGAGAVDVTTNEGSTMITLAALGLPASTGGDRFGAAVVVTDVDCNGAADLVVGAPGVDEGRGRVYVVLDPLGERQATKVQVLGSGQSKGSHFGTAVAAAGPTPQTRGRLMQDLWVGAPGEAPGTPYENEGTVSHYISKLDPHTGAWTGIAPVETIRPDLPGVTAYLGDAAYGAAIAASPGRVLIGSPDADLDDARDAGYVEERRNLDADPAYEFKFVWSRNTPGVPGDPASGDHFGAAVATSHEYSLIGAPGVDVGKAKDAGSALVLADVGSWSLPDRTVTYKSDGVPGAAHSGDHLGAAVTLGDNFGCTGTDSLQAALGAPGRDVSHAGHARKDAGAVVVFPVRDRYSDCKAPRILDQSRTLAGAPGTRHQVGSSLSVLPYTSAGVSNGQGDRVLIGIPGEDPLGEKNAGVVEAGPGIPPYLDSQSIPTSHGEVKAVMNSSGPVAGQQYGAVLASETGV